ncbi:hypothetical protein INT48_009241 [Thamnidium elegans]|uniref:Rho-GAP domain-containing protein n=1 Tax=Thamnidium elegans TaxID=101142 RepID=A0A8H7SJB9_9FUNG|nr:hypothetical protein INT48_009241 [Thamnidium elegans]
MPNQHPFQSSFWSPTSSIDIIPNFSLGFNVLHGKLSQSQSENKVIQEYIQERITAEKNHAQQLSSIIPTTHPFDTDIGGGLKRCFEVVYSESQESCKEHQIRAENLNTTALDPLIQFSNRYERIISQAKLTVETQMSQFDTVCKHMEQMKQYYQNRCKTLLVLQPDYRHTIKVGKLEFGTREDTCIWLQQELKDKTPRDKALTWLDTQSENDDANAMLQTLEQLEFLKIIDGLVEINSNNAPIGNPKGFAGFLGRWGNSGQQMKKEELVTEMLEADKNYRMAVEKVELMRTQIEQMLFVHYEEMEMLELERIQTIKHVFISVAASLSNTIPRSKETFDNMMLYQETLEPDKDVQFIVEQYRTGQYNPRPVLYENYFDGAAKDQLFGVPLDEITRTQSSLVPQLVSQGLSVIESAFLKLHDEEKRLVWTKCIPLDRIYEARAVINHGKFNQETLETFDILLLASLIRVYLMELPECLFTFELYEPCKLLYSSQAKQDKECRLVSISKLLATLPTSNYHTLKAMIQHFSRLIQQLEKEEKLSYELAKSFSYILMRPQIESKVSAHERNAQRLIQELIENFDIIFTEEACKAQQENWKRPSIIIASQSETKKSNSLDDGRASFTSSRRSSILSFMRTSQSTPTSSLTSKRNGAPLIIPMPSSSTLFEDPDEMVSSESSIVIQTPPSYVNHDYSKTNDHFVVDELASIDSFFEDED